MAIARTTKSLSLDRGVLDEVERTKGAASTSERINALIRIGLEVERKESLHAEAEAFFKSEDDRTARRALQSASIKSISREND